MSYQDRTYERIYFSKPILGKVSITRINDKAVETNRIQIEIHNLSQSGLSFISNLKFPLHCVELKFVFSLSGWVVELKGSAVWRKEVSESDYQYGVYFTKYTVHFYQALERLFNTMKAYNLQPLTSPNL